MTSSAMPRSYMCGYGNCDKECFTGDVGLVVVSVNDRRERFCSSLHAAAFLLEYAIIDYRASPHTKALADFAISIADRSRY
jgi:hypothetical protein